MEMFDLGLWWTAGGQAFTGPLEWSRRNDALENLTHDVEAL
jgi:hypothetical protein